MERSSSVLKKSAACALAGTAINVSAAEAAPIYFTGPNVVYRADASTPTSDTPIDIDGDGNDDYRLSLSVWGSHPFPTTAQALWYSLGTNAVAFDRSIGLVPSVGMIGPASNFETFSTLVKDTEGFSGGYPWPNNGVMNPGFIGLRFQTNGQTHYGWASVGVNVSAYSGLAEAKVHGWAYEQTPDTAIAASMPTAEVDATPLPEPSTMALFALGSAGVAAFRRRRQQS